MQEEQHVWRFPDGRDLARRICAQADGCRPLRLGSQLLQEVVESFCELMYFLNNKQMILQFIKNMFT